MFIRKLVIISNNEIIRDIRFHKGINLIVDNTPVNNQKLTGNNVGKTTVLKLIDFCLGAEANIIYTGTENRKDVYEIVKDYLKNNKVIIELTLTNNLEIDESEDDIVIRRNFLKYKEKILSINGVEYSERDFEEKLSQLVLGKSESIKPSFRQIISHNIRYKDENINNTLRTLNNYTSDVEYEILHLFLFGCSFSEGANRQELLTKIKQEEEYKRRLEKSQTKKTYEMTILMINDEIEELNAKKKGFKLNENFEKDFERLNNIKYEINKYSSEISKLKIRENIIIESKEELEKNIANIDINQLKLIYFQASNQLEKIQHTFEELVKFHNDMIIEKVRFITEDLPDLRKRIENNEEIIKNLLEEEQKLTQKVTKSDSFEELDKIIEELGKKNKKKGEYEVIVSQITEVENNIKNLKQKIDEMEEVLFSDDFDENIQKQLRKFSKYFSEVSEELYGEKYAVTYKKKLNKNKQNIYSFECFNTNLSSGKKQGEILCFDLAYILFADSEKIPCIHFILNDKKELLHRNQLERVNAFVKNKNIQLVVSILKDKLPSTLSNKENIIIELSQEKKLFKIE